MTIFEAIANAGDLSTIAKRDEILLIRQYPEGTKLHRINLNDRMVINSPFYFIQPNDQLYAEPMKVREIGAGENAAQSILLIATTLTTILLVVNLFTSN
jgi:polysaccharide export outer membrane protein